MWFGNKSKTNITETVLNVEQDVQEMVARELVLFKRNPDNKNFEQSAIANIALFNLPAITTEQGYEQIVNLFQDHFSQMVGRRINQLLHTLYIRYGSGIIAELTERSMSGMEQVYDINETLLHRLFNEVPSFWLQPFIRKAYFDIVDAMTTVEK